MKMSTIAEKLLVQRGDERQYSEIELKKMKVGLEIILINLSKMAIICILGIFFDFIIETIFVIILFWFLRLHTFGLHAKNTLTCTMITIFTHIITPLMIYEVKLNNMFIYCVYFGLVLCIFKYAPADTENHPLLFADQRRELKIKAVLSGFICFCILFFVDDPIKNIMLSVTFYVVLGILPITYKILNRRYNNYEDYQE